MNNFIIYFSIWIIVVPFLGIPSIWRNWIVSISGLILFLVYFFPVIAIKLKTKIPTKKIKAKLPSEESIKKREELFEEVDDFKFNSENNTIKDIDKNDFKE